MSQLRYNDGLIPPSQELACETHFRILTFGKEMPYELQRWEDGDWATPIDWVAVHCGPFTD